MATRCKFPGRRGILSDVMKISGSLGRNIARNIDFDVAFFQVLRKTRRKTVILKLQSVKIGGNLARNARFDAPTYLVSSLWFSCGLAVSVGEAAKPLLFEGFQAGCYVVLRGRSGTLGHSNLFDNVSKVILCGRRNTFATFLQDELQFSWQAAFRRSLSSFCVASAALFSDVSHCLLYAPHSTLYTLHFTLLTPHSTLYTLHSTLYTLHSTLYTPHCTLHTVHSTLYTLHFTLHTLHSTLYTPHFTPHTLHYTSHSALYTLHFSLHTLRRLHALR